jgi:nitrite reductase/ring-hydroxylating ferredoxin subunit
VRAIEHRWSNQVFAPVDGLPFVGLLHEHEHVYAGTGYAGNGLTLGTMAGVLLAGLVTGRDTDLTQLLSPARVHAVNASTKTSVVTSLPDAPWRWVAARLRGADAHLVVDLPADVGQVVEINGQRAAVYRDRGRQLHFLSPVCTHAGCTVGWNQAEKTWDCPCHGGRYDALGAVLCAPPSRDLDGEVAPIVDELAKRVIAS